MQITKTDYLEYTFCKKNLWLKKHKPELFDGIELSEFEKKIIEEGNLADEEARNLFPGGVLIDSSGADALADTKKYIEKKVGVIFQATFSEDLFFIRSDILIYNADFVPVGLDQKQHVELARDIAQRFNSNYSDTFTLPEAKISENAAKIMDLQDPSKKMSKSDDNQNSYILVLDPPDVIRKKVSRAVTDSVGIVNYTDEQPGVKNLINIICAIRNMKPDEVVASFVGKGYKEFKEYVAEVIIEELEPVQKKANELLTDKAKLEEIYSDGAMKANYAATKVLRKMQKKVGLLPPVRK